MDSAAIATPRSADNTKLGLYISVASDDLLLNPLVTKLVVTDVAKGSLAAGAGIVAADEIMQIEGRMVVGARDFQPFMHINPGKTRTLYLKHADGEQFDTRLTKAKGGSIGWLGELFLPWRL